MLLHIFLQDPEHILGHQVAHQVIYFALMLYQDVNVEIPSMMAHSVQYIISAKSQVFVEKVGLLVVQVFQAEGIFLGLQGSVEMRDPFAV